MVTKDYVKWQKGSLHPDFFHDNKIATDFSKKADLTVLSCQYLAKIEFTKDAIERIICKTDLNKAHGHDMISIYMLMP